MDTEERRIGRPTDCTPDVIATIADAVSRGATFRLASQSVGISPQTFYTWKQKGEAGEYPYRDFLDALTRAEGEHATRLASVLNRLSAEAEDPRVAADAAKFMLERRHPKDYGRTVQEVEHTGTVGVVKVELPTLPEDASPEERRALLRAMVGR